MYGEYTRDFARGLMWKIDDFVLVADRIWPPADGYEVTLSRRNVAFIKCPNTSLASCSCTWGSAVEILHCGGVSWRTLSI